MKNKFESTEFLIKTLEAAFSDDECVIVEGTGDSMRPFITPETDKIVLYKPQKKLKAGQIVLYLRDGSQPVIHRIYKVHKNTIDALGDNQIRIEYGVPKNDIIALVTKRIRNGEEFDCLDSIIVLKASILMKRRLVAYRFEKLKGSFYEKHKGNNKQKR